MIEMKNLKTSKLLAAVALAGVVAFSSCKKDDDDKVEQKDEMVLEGDIEKDIVLSKDNVYILRGGVHVKEPYTIKIEPGVTVYADATPGSGTAYLLIEPGAKILAEGKADEPIVFTPNKPEGEKREQDWGGIILCGKAPVNGEGGKIASEMGDGVVYGGDKADDNSGVLRYVRVEFTGKKQTANKEHNGFTFEGVGNGTVAEYLAVYRGGDDAFEWFGGTVDAKYLFAYGAQDDTFDWTFGWSGKGQFWVGVQAQGDGAVADRGIEADNSGKNQTATPYSNPTISNVTLVGSLTAATGDDPTQAVDKGKTIGLKLREGTKGQLYNFVVYNFSHGIDVQHEPTVNNAKDGGLVFKNSDIHNANPWKFNPVLDPNPFIATGYNNTVEVAGTPSYITNTYVGTNATGALDPSSLDSYFAKAAYKGAVPADNDWTKGAWVRFK